MVQGRGKKALQLARSDYGRKQDYFMPTSSPLREEEPY